MFKILVLMKRKRGMSKADFIGYYESTHVKIGLTIFGGHAVKYIRRYLHPLYDPAAYTRTVPHFDVAMEAWFDDREHWEAALKVASTPEMVKLSNEDHDQFCDHFERVVFEVEEHESDLGPVRSLPRKLD
jgi:EthD domain